MTSVMRISEVTAPQREVELVLQSCGFQPAGTRITLWFVEGFRRYKCRSCLCPGKYVSDALGRGVIWTECTPRDLPPLKPTVLSSLGKTFCLGDAEFQTRSFKLAELRVINVHGKSPSPRSDPLNCHVLSLPANLSTGFPTSPQKGSGCSVVLEMMLFWLSQCSQGLRFWQAFVNPKSRGVKLIKVNALPLNPSSLSTAGEEEDRENSSYSFWSDMLPRSVGRCNLVLHS